MKDSSKGESLYCEASKIKWKEIFWDKYGVVWKFPLLMLSMYYLSHFFIDHFLKMQFIFTIGKEGMSRFASQEFISMYSGIYEKGFYENGIHYIPIELSSLIVVLLFAKILDRFSNKDMGIEISIKKVFLFIIGFIIGIVAISGVCYGLDLLGIIHIEGVRKLIGFKKKYLMNMIIFQGFLYFLVAIQEEILTRAYLINNLKWAGYKIAILFSAIIFATLHLWNIGSVYDIATLIGIFNIGLIGFLYAMYYIKYKELWFLIGIHFGWNYTLSALYGLAVSNIETLKGMSFLKVNIIGESTIMTGGAFGPEGSIVTTIMLLLVLVAVVSLNKRKKQANKCV